MISHLAPDRPECVKEALHAAPRLEEALLGLPEGVALQAYLGAGEDVIHLQVGRTDMYSDIHIQLFCRLQEHYLRYLGWGSKDLSKHFVS